MSYSRESSLASIGDYTPPKKENIQAEFAKHHTIKKIPQIPEPFVDEIKKQHLTEINALRAHYEEELSEKERMVQVKTEEAVEGIKELLSAELLKKAELESQVYQLQEKLSKVENLDLKNELDKYKEMSSRLSHDLSVQVARNKALEMQVKDLTLQLHGKVKTFELPPIFSSFVVATTITHYEIRKEASEKSYIAYLIDVEMGTGHRFTCARRYKHFEQYHPEVARMLGESAPELPGKGSPFDSFNDVDKIAGRKCVFQSYLNTLVGKPDIHYSLLHFLKEGPEKKK